MSTTGLAVFDTTVQKMDVWLRDIMQALGWEDQHTAYAPPRVVAFPTVPRGTARRHVMLSAAHSRDDGGFALETFARLGQACQLIPAT